MDGYVYDLFVILDFALFDFRAIMRGSIVIVLLFLLSLDWAVGYRQGLISMDFSFHPRSIRDSLCSLWSRPAQPSTVSDDLLILLDICRWR